jgi:hypothetical protein
MLALSRVVSYWLLIFACLFCWCNVLIVFLLYFPVIDANNSGEEEEVVRTRILFILTGFLYWWSWRSPGTNKPRQAIFWSLAIYPSCCAHCSIIHLVPCIICDFWSSTLCILIPKVCWTPCWCFAYLLPSMWTPLLMLCMLTLSMYAPLTISMLSSS